MLFDDRPLITLLGFASVILFEYFAILVHEAGHWLAARLCGFRVLGFSVGEGVKVFERNKNGSFVDFRLVPVSGYVLPFKESGKVTRWQDFAVSAAGPCATLMILLGLILAYQTKPFTFVGEPWSMYCDQCVIIAMVMTIVTLGYNLIPHDGFVGSSTVANDGKQMLASLLRPGYPRDNDYQQQLRALFPNESRLYETDAGRDLYAQWLTLMNREKREETFHRLAENIQNPDMPSHEQVLFQFLAGECALLSDKPGIKREALDMLAEACELDEDNLLLRTCYGALCVERQHYIEARRIFMPLSSGEAPVPIRCYSLAWLAIAAVRQNDREGAEKLLAEARRLDPFHPAVARANREVKGLSKGYVENIGREI